MKIDWKYVVIILLVGFVTEFICKTSGIVSLQVFEPLLLVFVSLITLSSGYLIITLYLVLSIILDLALLQPVGFTLLAFFASYIILRGVNSIFGFIKKDGLVFKLFVLLISIFAKQLLLIIFVSNIYVAIPFFPLVIFLILAVIFETIISKILFTSNAYKR